MKILFCDNSLRELLNFRRDIIVHYLQRGDEVFLIAPINTELDISHENLTLYNIELKRSGMNPISDIKYFLNLVKKYKSIKPDYVIHYTIKPNIYGTLAAKINNIPSSAMIAGLGYVFGRNGIRPLMGRMLYKFSMRFAKHILVLNQYNKDLVINKGIAKESQVILLKGGEGINLEKFV